LTVTGTAFARNHSLKFERLSLEQGLSQSVVTCIVQDRQGFMWFGTMDGLNKYDGYEFTVFKHDPLDSNSISHNHITALYEDSSGTLWIGTRAGLHRFDRIREKFIRYQHDPNIAPALSQNGVTALIAGKSQNRLWVGTTAGGLSLLDTQTGRVVAFKNDAQDPASLPGNRVQALAMDRTGALWVGTWSGLARLEHLSEDGRAASFTIFNHDPNNSSSLSNNAIWSIHEDSRNSGTLWITTFGGGINRFERATGQFKAYRHQTNEPFSLSHDVVRPVCEDRQGTLWFGTGDGLNRYDREHDHFLSYKHDAVNPKSLSTNDVWAIYEDASGALWIGTYGGGLNKFSSAGEKFEHYDRDPNDPQSLGHNMVMAIAEDQQGRLWIGTGGGGLYQVLTPPDNGGYTHGMQFKRYAHDSANPRSLSNDGVAAICAGYYRGQPALWVGTGKGLHRMTVEGQFVRYQYDAKNPHSLGGNGVSVIFASPLTGALWVGTGAGGLNRFVGNPDTTNGAHAAVQEGFIRYQSDPANRNSLSSNAINSLAESRLYDRLYLWIGTVSGLNRLNQVTGEIEQYRHLPNDSLSLSSDQVLAIYADPDSAGRVLWIGTAGGGLNLFEVQSEKFTVFTEKDGLPNGVIYGILGDDRGHLWLSTNNGLSRFSKATRRFRNYSVADGLQSNEFNQGAAFRNGKGEMFFGGIGGFNRFHPDQVKDNPYVPPIVLTSFKKLDKEVGLDTAISASTQIKLSYRDYFIAFAFAALDYTHPEKNQYAYRLEGFDEDWVYCGTRRYAIYTNLDGGRYRFRVKGANSDGMWNESGIAISVLVAPPFWKTWWFLTGAAMLLTGGGVLFHRRRLRLRLEKARLANELQAAHDMQMRLMPARAPQIPGFDIAGVCRPAEEVGGDFFDYIWLDENKTKLGIVVVDVSDKAIAGAMTAVLTSGMISSEVATFRAPRLLLRRINKTMHHKTDRHVFTAMSFAALDIADKTLTFANAGQTEPLLLRAGRLKYLQVEGMRLPLGLQKHVEYNEATLALHSGDLLVFYTDGLTDAMNSEQESFGQERLESTLAELPASLNAEEIVNAMFREVAKFTGAVRQYDDMTVVVVRAGGAEGLERRG
jgi:serine phosphatase RsbU (regulator of sigma subunit)/ligand-binding sensor domain-containing protein